MLVKVFALNTILNIKENQLARYRMVQLTSLCYWSPTLKVVIIQNLHLY